MNLAATAPVVTQSDLQSLTAKIDSEYYEVIEQLNARIGKALTAAGSAVGTYFDLCNELSLAIGSVVDERRSVLVPYLVQLQEKKADGHNCSTCSGVCKVQHSVYIATLINSHAQIRNIIDGISSQRDIHDVPGQSDTVTLFEFVITNMILDLFDVEEKELIPEIIKAQKAINAH
jgi:hypothetical protein